MNNAKQYFDNHNAVDILYFTSDDLAFFDEQNAKTHAAHLENKTIKTMTRAEIDKELEDLAADLWDDDIEYDPLDEPDAE